MRKLLVICACGMLLLAGLLGPVVMSTSVPPATSRAVVTPVYPTVAATPEKDQIGFAWEWSAYYDAPEHWFARTAWKWSPIQPSEPGCEKYLKLNPTDSQTFPMIKGSCHASVVLSGVYRSVIESFPSSDSYTENPGGLPK